MDYFRTVPHVTTRGTNDKNTFRLPDGPLIAIHSTRDAYHFFFEDSEAGNAAKSKVVSALASITKTRPSSEKDVHPSISSRPVLHLTVQKSSIRKLQPRLAHLDSEASRHNLPWAYSVKKSLPKTYLKLELILGTLKESGVADSLNISDSVSEQIARKLGGHSRLR